MLNSQVLTQTTQVRPWLKSALLVIGASALIALSAQVRIPLPFTPVPISMQSFMVLLLAGMLGSKKGSFAVIAYLAEGALGLPVFASGHAGWSYLTGTTGGYFIGFIVAAYVVGWLLERKRNPSTLYLISSYALGTVAILAIGAGWLSKFVGFQAALSMGVFPFLFGDLVIKVALAVSGTRALKAIKF